MNRKGIAYIEHVKKSQIQIKEISVGIEDDSDNCEHKDVYYVGSKPIFFYNGFKIRALLCSRFSGAFGVKILK